MRQTMFTEPIKTQAGTNPNFLTSLIARVLDIDFELELLQSFKIAQASNTAIASYQLAHTHGSSSLIAIVLLFYQSF